MSKIKILNKYTLFFGLSLVLFFFVSHGTAIMNIDDLWNFNFVLNVANGKVPYLETNIMVPPFYHFTAALFLNIFGKNYFSLMLFQIFFEALLFTLSYLFIDKNLKSRVTKVISILLSANIMISLTPIQYNALFLLFAFLVIYLEGISFKNQDFKSILMGILLGLGLLCKQTYGGIFIFFYFCFLLVAKRSMKNFLMTILGLLIPNTIFLIYLLSTNSLFAFWDQCVLALFEFAEKNLFFAILYIAPSIVLGIVSAFLSFISYRQTKQSNFLLNGIFSIASFFLVYPIFNVHHLYLSFFIILPTLILQLERIYFEIENEKTKKITKKLAVFIIVFVAIVTVANVNQTFSKTQYHENIYGLNKYYNITPFDDIFYKSIRNVVDFIEEKKAEGYTPVVLSSDGPNYYVFTECPIKYDLVLSGNMGYNGVKNIIGEVEKLPNPIILKMELQSYCYQEPEELENYVLENFEQSGSIESLRVFEKKK